MPCYTDPDNSQYLRIIRHMKVVFNPMLSNQHKTHTLFNLIIKCSAIFFLFFISILIAACSSNGTSQLNTGTPVVTVTINLGKDIGSPTPTLSPYYCGGWAADTSPSFRSTSIVSIFGKITQIVDGNPVGIGGATAIATIQWPDGTSDTMSTTTTSDGLAVFPISIKPSAINKLVTISIAFTKTGIQQCTIPSVAYFTAILGSPTSAKTVVPSTSTPLPIPTKGH